MVKKGCCFFLFTFYMIHVAKRRLLSRTTDVIPVSAFAVIFRWILCPTTANLKFAADHLTVQNIIQKPPLFFPLSLPIISRYCARGVIIISDPAICTFLRFSVCECLFRFFQRRPSACCTCLCLGDSRVAEHKWTNFLDIDNTAIKARRNAASGRWKELIIVMK